MNKVFLYLYPVKEFYEVFLHSNCFYDEINREKPFSILNECIQKRYREQGYKIVYAIYKDKNIYGIELKPTDRIIYTDITFEQTTLNPQDKTSSMQFNYPSEEYLISQLGNIDEIVVGGFHFKDCVRRVSEYCYQKGINTLVDLDLTDLFFNLYYQKDYFKIEEYDPKKYKEFWMKKAIYNDEKIEFLEKQFNFMYDSPVYGFYSEQSKKTK